ncbi:MAG: hypothetical protein AAGF12_41075 [Myxococcota bacterium]
MAEQASRALPDGHPAAPAVAAAAAAAEADDVSAARAAFVEARDALQP